MKTLSIAVPAAVEAGAASEISTNFRKSTFTAWLTGVGTATYQLQISPDGTNFFNEGDALTASGPVAVTKHARAIRWDCTAYTSGTPTSQAIFDE